MKKPTLDSATQRRSLTQRIIADMTPGEELGDQDCRGLRVRCTTSGNAYFFYRYRAPSGALRQISLGKFGPLTLAGARKELAKKRLLRDDGIELQGEKRKARAAAQEQYKAER